MDSLTMEGIWESFEEKISNICAKFALLNEFEINNDEVGLTTKSIASIQGMLFEVREEILRQNSQLDVQMNSFKDLYQVVTNHMAHIEEQDRSLNLNLTGKVVPIKDVKSKNVNGRTPLKTGANKPKLNLANGRTPTILRTSETPKNVSKNAPKSTNCDTKAAEIKESTITKQTSKTELAAGPPSRTRSIASIDQVTHGEYNVIPSYMIGRIQLDTLNEFIDTFNSTITKKYEFLATHKSSNSTDHDHKKFQAYKALEFADTRNQYFCTVNDLKENIPSKIAAILPKILICLRHCKRIREIRGGKDPKNVRYAVVVA